MIPEQLAMQLTESFLSQVIMFAYVYREAITVFGQNQQLEKCLKLLHFLF